MKLNDNGGVEYAVRDRGGRYLRTADDPGDHTPRWTRYKDEAETWETRQDALEAMLTVGLATLETTGAALDKLAGVDEPITPADGYEIVEEYWVDEEDLKPEPGDLD